MKEYIYRLWQWVYKGIPVMKVPLNMYNLSEGKLLDGRKILITGGSKGIGRHIAEAYIKQGADVVIVGRNIDSLETTSREIGCKYIQYDLFKIDGLECLIANAGDMLGGLDGLVNNAGVCLIDNGFVNVTEESFDKQFQLNVKSPFFLTQAFVKHCIENKVNSAGVLFVTSERGLYPDDAPYGMTKAAIGNIISGIARKFALNGIHCNGIAPGVTKGLDYGSSVPDDIYLKGSVGKRFIMPQELADVAAFLMSDLSKCISGEIIPCNQGNHYK